MMACLDLRLDPSVYQVLVGIFLFLSLQVSGAATGMEWVPLEDLHSLQGLVAFMFLETVGW